MTAHLCGHARRHRRRWMRWLCNACRGGNPTEYEHFNYGVYYVGPPCGACWGEQSHGQPWFLLGVAVVVMMALLVFAAVTG